MEIVISKLVPLSYNSKNRKNRNEYKKKIRSAFSRKYKGVVPKFPAAEELYARVYFFTNCGINVDCDNISKPIWDAVKNLIYDDDCQIILRTATVIDLKIHPVNIDTSSIDGAVAADLMQELSEKDVKCLYIECGNFKESMIKIGESNI